VIAELVVDGRLTIPFTSMSVRNGRIHFSGSVVMPPKRARRGLTGMLPVVLYGADEEPVQSWVRDVTGLGLDVMAKGSNAIFEWDLRLESVHEEIGLRSPRSNPPFVSGVTG